MRKVPAVMTGVLFLSLFTGLGIAVSAAPAMANTVSSPNPAPLPGTLPDGQPAAAATLNGSSCSSTSFCVAVGWVSDAGNDSFPLIETFAGGTWTPSIAPLPSAQGSHPAGSLTGVSCAADGSCSAVGDYDDFNATADTAYQSGLLETLSGGTWASAQAPLPSGPDSGLVNINSVSCGTTTACIAVGQVDDFPSNSRMLLVYSGNGATWTLDSAPPSPPTLASNLTMASVACPDANDCVAVGAYTDTAGAAQGAIYTLSAGAWSTQESPLPPGANNSPAVSAPVLDAVDCVAVGSCEAGGTYFDASGHQNAMFVSLAAGTWTATAAPVASDAQANPLALISGISCPAAGSCVADGSYWISYDTNQNGMVLDQSGDSWVIVSPPGAPALSDSVRGGHHKKAAAVRESLNALTCVSAKFCRAVGSNGKHAVIEKVKAKTPKHGH
jgi:hypothetical protein